MNDPKQVGARQAAKREGGAPWAALLVLLLLVLLGLGAWFFFLDDDGDVEAIDDGDTPTTMASEATPTSTPTSTPTTRGDAAPGPGEVFAGGQAVLPGGESELTRFVGQPAEGRSVEVLSVPSDEGFWVGTGDTNRVFVHLSLSPNESPFNVDPGETVTFRGTMEALPGDAEEQFGLTDDEGLSDLRRQGAYIEATSVTGA